MRMKIWCISLIFFCLPSMGYSALTWKEIAKNGFSAEATLSATTISIQENLEIGLLLTYPLGYHVDVDQLKTNLFKHSPISIPGFRLATFKKRQVDDHSTAFLFILEPLVEGKHSLTFYNIDFIHHDPQKITTIISDIFDVTVTSPISSLETETPPKMQPLMTFSENYPIEISEDNRKKLLESSSVMKNEAAKNLKILKVKTMPWKMLLLVISGLILFIFRKQLIEILKEPKPQKDLALEASQKSLAKMENLNQQKHSEFYADLSNIVREFIEERYHLPTSGYTTQEFINALAEKPLFDPPLQELLSNFLHQADDVKFAKHTPSPKECQQALNIVRNIVTK